jgi:hypothetical protein
MATVAASSVIFIGPSTHFREPVRAVAEKQRARFENYGGGFIEHFKLSGHESFSKQRPLSLKNC